MKTKRPLLFLVILLAMATAAGCAASPQDRWFQQREALTSASRIYLAHTQIMSDEQVVHYGQLLQTARARLDEAKIHLPQGGSVFDSAMDVVESILARIAALEAQRTLAQPPRSEEASNDTR